jgi:tetratricopeptide (TPR) repeat protein
MTKPFKIIFGATITLIVVGLLSYFLDIFVFPLLPQTWQHPVVAVFASFVLLASLAAAIVQITGYPLRDLLARKEADLPPSTPTPSEHDSTDSKTQLHDVQSDFQRAEVGGRDIIEGDYVLGDKILGSKVIVDKLDIHAATPIITTPFNLPSGLPDFIGRDSQIAQLRKCLTAKDDMSVALIFGMGGIGKTALALHIVAQLAAEGQFSDAQLYIDLRGMDPSPLDPALALNTLLAAVWGPDPCRPQDVNALAGLWRQALQGKQYVIILDNAANPQQVRPLLPSSPSGVVVITSRRRFMLPGACLLDLNRMDPEEASTLLQKLTPRLAFTEAHQIAELCGKLPLALRIAGNYLCLNDDCTAQEYATRLSDERKRLKHLRDPSDHELDVAATLSLSVAQLDAEMRQAWSLLHLFLAPFDDTAAASLWGSTEHMTLDQLPKEVAAHYGTDQTEIAFSKKLDENKTRERLRSLRNRSLISFDSASGRYQMHDLLRLLAAEEAKVFAERELAGAYNRMVSHYAFVADVANTFQRYSDLDPDWPHCLLALEVALSESEQAPEFLSTLVSVLCGYWSARGMARAKRFWCSKAAAACSAAGRLQQMATHLVNMGDAYVQLGLLREASEIYAKGLSVAREIGDRQLEAVVLGTKSTVIVSRNDALVAIESLEIALSIHQELGAKRAVESDFGRLGNAFVHLHDYDQATESYSQAIQIAHEIEDERGEADWLGNLGSVLIQGEDWEKARNTSERALALHRKVGDRPGEANNLINLGQALANLGDLPNALDSVETALNIWREIGNANKEAACLHTLASIQLLSGDMTGAADTYRRALEVCERNPNPAEEADILDELGRVCTILGDTEEGIGHLDDAVAISREIEDPWRESRSLLKLGAAQAATGEYEYAIASLKQALSLTFHILRLDSKGSSTWSQTCRQIAAIHEALSVAYLDANHTEEALEHSKKAFDVPPFSWIGD